MLTWMLGMSVLAYTLTQALAPFLSCVLLMLRSPNQNRFKKLKCNPAIMTFARSGWLPVHWAAQSGSVETLCNLHYLGSDFTSRTYVGETALHIAAQYNDGAMIQVLLASNADIEELNVELRTALHMAAANGQTVALQTLLFYKADPDKVVEDDSGLTAFLLAVTYQREMAVQVMPLRRCILLRAEGLWGDTVIPESPYCSHYIGALGSFHFF